MKNKEFLILRKSLKTNTEQKGAQFWLTVGPSRFPDGNPANRPSNLKAQWIRHDSCLLKPHRNSCMGWGWTRHSWGCWCNSGIPRIEVRDSHPSLLSVQDFLLQGKGCQSVPCWKKSLPSNPHNLRRGPIRAGSWSFLGMPLKSLGKEIGPSSSEILSLAAMSRWIGVSWGQAFALVRLLLQKGIYSWETICRSGRVRNHLLGRG